MSAHPEYLQGDAETAHDSAEETSPLDLEFTENDSLVLLGAAGGGAILGVLVTLLVLALINGGTLNFSQVERITALEDAYEALRGNVDANTQNLDTVATQVVEIDSIATGMNNDIGQLLGTAEQQGGDIDTLGDAIAAMDATRGDMDALVNALSGALSQMSSISTSAADGPMVESAVSVPVGDVEVLLFVDENGNSTMDPGEASQPGITVSLVDADGGVAATLESTDSGLVFEDLAPGDYQLELEDNGGYAALSELDASFTVPADGETGQIVYVPITAE